MSRRCGICTSPNRAAIEQKLAAGERIRDVAVVAGVSGSAVQRHSANHFGRAVLNPVTGTVHLADIADRMAVLLNDCSAVREYAARTNDAALLLRAVATESSVLTTLVYRLGVGSSDTASAVRDSRDLASAVRQVVLRSSPTMATEIAGALDSVGSHELAAAFSNLATHVSNREIA